MSLADLKKIPYGKTAIELKNISLAFGGVKALTDVSFEVKKGEVFAIIGPNGAGKSSMLNVINGFYKPTSGTINFAGTQKTRQPNCSFGLLNPGGCAPWTPPGSLWGCETVPRQFFVMEKYWKKPKINKKKSNEKSSNFEKNPIKNQIKINEILKMLKNLIKNKNKSKIAQQIK